MNPESIFTWVPHEKRSKVFLFLLSITILVGASLQILGKPLVNSVTPAGILSLEFAGGIREVEQILAAWGPEVQVIAGIQIGLDYLFLVCYSLTIALGCVLLALQVGGVHLTSVGLWVARLQFAAAGLDALENYGMVRLLLGSTNPMWASFAFWGAAMKFTLIATGILYILVGTISLGFRKTMSQVRSKRPAGTN